jgi:ATP-binding cassette subfamily C protein
MLDFKTLLKELKSYKKELVLANLIACFAVLISTPTPLLIPLLVDEVLLGSSGVLVYNIDSIIHGPNPAYVYVLVVLAITVFMRVLFFALSVWQSYLFTKVSQNIVYKIRKSLLGHLKGLDLSSYEVFSGAKVSSLLVVDLATLEEFLSSSISKLIISVLTVVGVGIVLLLIEWKLALLILFLNPFIVYFTTKLARRVAKIKRKENALIEAFSESLNKTLEFYEQIKVSNKTEHFVKNLDVRAKDVRDSAMEFRYKSEASSRFSYLFFLSGFELFRAAGILMAFYDDLSIGLMLAVFGYLWVIMGPVQEIIGIQYAYANAKAALTRINTLYKLKQEPSCEVKEDPFFNKVTNAIEVENLCFNYGDHMILKDVSLKVDVGQKIAIVGASGSGKTTLAKLLVGFYTPECGVIKYDGVDAKEIGLEKIRDNVYLVLQTPQLFTNTLLYNLTFGDDVSQERLHYALEVAELKEFVDRQKDGLETLVGSEGVSLSGGERQRVAIARMVIKDPNIVFLDESTSALDSLTEAKVFGKLQEYLKAKTTIMIAHRLSTIKSADYIYVLGEGRVIEEGTLEELLQSDGKFSEFYNRD